MQTTEPNGLNPILARWAQGSTDETQIKRINTDSNHLTQSVKIRLIRVPSVHTNTRTRVPHNDDAPFTFVLWQRHSYPLCLSDILAKEAKGEMQSVVHYNKERCVILSQPFTRQGYALVTGNNLRKTAAKEG